MDRGFSLLEMMITVAILTGIAVVAVPSYQQNRKEQQLHQLANNLLHFGSQAKYEAVVRNKDLALIWTPATATSPWKLTLHAGVNEADEVLARIKGDEYSTLKVEWNFNGANHFKFDRLNGRPLTGGNIRFWITQGESIKVTNSSVSGRQRVCAVEKAAYGYPKC